MGACYRASGEAGDGVGVGVGGVGVGSEDEVAGSSVVDAEEGGGLDVVGAEGAEGVGGGEQAVHKARSGRSKQRTRPARVS